MLVSSLRANGKKKLQEGDFQEGFAQIFFQGPLWETIKGALSENSGPEFITFTSAWLAYSICGGIDDDSWLCG